MTNKERDNLLLDMKKSQKLHDELLLDMKNSLDTHEKLLVEMKTQLENTNAKVSKHDEDFKSNREEFKAIHEELRNISRSVAKIEVEHGSKIETLLDGQTAIFEKLDSFENRFKSNEETLDNHSDRIWNLESKVGII